MPRIERQIGRTCVIWCHGSQSFVGICWITQYASPLGGTSFALASREFGHRKCHRCVHICKHIDTLYLQVNSARLDCSESSSRFFAVLSSHMKRDIFSYEN